MLLWQFSLVVTLYSGLKTDSSSTPPAAMKFVNTHNSLIIAQQNYHRHKSAADRMADYWRYLSRFCKMVLYLGKHRLPT